MGGLASSGYYISTPLQSLKSKKKHTVIEARSVQAQAKRGLDTGAQRLGVTEAEDTGIVDLGLDKRSIVEVGLGADLQRDTASGRLGVVHGLGTGLDVLADLVVVRGGKGRQVAQAVQGDGVLGGRKADGTGVTGNGTRGDVVGGLGTDEEAITADDSVGGESGALEEVDGGAGVERGLLVDGSDNGRLLRLGGVQGGRNVELEALGDLVLELELGAEQVGGGPGL